MNEYRSLEDLYEATWHILRRGVVDRRAAARHPTLATVSVNGDPQARTVVLRAAQKESATLEVHTDIASAKYSELSHYPRASFHVWDPKAKLQLRLLGDVQVKTCKDAQSAWDKVPSGARVSYGSIPPPGTQINTAFEYTKLADQSRFAVLQCQLLNMDILYLGERHQRAGFTRDDSWRGCWLSP